MTTFVIGLIVGGALAGVTVAYADRHIAATADWKLRTAQEVRLQADEILADAEGKARYVEAVETPTAEYRIVSPLTRVKSVVRSARERLAPAPTPDWTPTELRRIQRETASDRRMWPLRRSTPTPLQVAQRLASLRDPSREFRVIKVRTS